MKYYINKRILEKDTKETYELTFLEGKFLASFRDEKTMLYSQLCEKVYDIECDSLEDALKEIKSKVTKKYGIEFKTRYKIGYVLITNIEFIY